MIKLGSMVTSDRVNGLVTKFKKHQRDNAEITLVEVHLQNLSGERPIYAYVNDEFFIIKPTRSAPHRLELVK